MQGQARRGYEETSLEGARNVAADCADGWTAPTRRWGRRDAVLRRLSGRFRCPNPFAWDDEGRTGASSFAASRRYCCTSRACRASGICAAGPSAGPLDGVMRRRCPGRRCVIPSAAHHAAAVRAADDEHADLIFFDLCSDHPAGGGGFTGDTRTWRACLDQHRRSWPSKRLSRGDRHG